MNHFQHTHKKLTRGDCCRNINLQRVHILNTDVSGVCNCRHFRCCRQNVNANVWRKELNFVSHDQFNKNRFRVTFQLISQYAKFAFNLNVKHSFEVAYYPNIEFLMENIILNECFEAKINWHWDVNFIFRKSNTFIWYFFLLIRRELSIDISLMDGISDNIEKLLWK